MRIVVDTRDFEKLRQELKKFSKKAIPYAARQTLNGQAFHHQAEWRGEIKRTFTNRNKYTVGSIRVDKVKGLDLRTMRAVVGSVAPYMGDQEAGATVRGKGKHKAIPGPAAAGLKPGSRRTKTVRHRFRLSSISVSHPSLSGLGRRRQNAVAIAVALRKGEQFVLLNRIKGKARGLFAVKGLKRKAKVKLLYNLGKSSVRVKAEPTMHRAYSANVAHFKRIAEEALRDQMRRQRLFNR